ncbi:MAG TPA: VanW family protein [Feifaniaceae bacterium]|nr:VanW family protein [Feifaniaceae bacterium]
MDQIRQGQRGVSKNDGPQLPNYMKQQAQSAVRRSYAAASNAGAPRVPSARTAPQQGARTGGGSGGRKKRRPTRSQKYLRLGLGVLALLVVAVAAVLLLTGGDKEDPTMTEYMNSDTRFLSGVAIEGVDVSGLPMEEAKPLVEQAVAGRLNSVSITLQHEDKSWTLTAADMNVSANTEEILTEAMGFGRDGTLSENAEEREELEQGREFSVTPKPDVTAATNRLITIASEANEPPVEPHLIPTLDESNAQNFEPVEGQNGLSLNAEQTAQAVVAAMEQKQYQAAVPPVFDSVAPTMTLDFLMENTKRISTFTTKFPQSSSDEIVKNRVFNIKKAAGIINGYTVQPDEEWSFNGWVGPRTAKTGWKEANGISGGKEYTLQAGGGICQVSTTLYNTLLCGNLPITDRKAHSIPSSYVDKGLDATVDTSGIDLKFKNDTGAPVYIFAYITPDPKSSRNLQITVSLYGKPLPEGVTYKARSEIIETTPRLEVKYVDDPAIPMGYQMEKIKAHDGFKAKAYLEKYVNGELAETRELYEDRYRGNDAEVHIGTGDPLTVPVPDGAVPIAGGTLPETAAPAEGGADTEQEPPADAEPAE